jgi:hypothetical protein
MLTIIAAEWMLVATAFGAQGLLVLHAVGVGKEPRSVVLSTLALVLVGDAATFAAYLGLMEVPQPPLVYWLFQPPLYRTKAGFGTLVAL